VRLYALEPRSLERLLVDRQDLLAYAKSKTSEEWHKDRDDLYASVPVYRTPDAAHPLQLQVVNGVAHIPVVGELTPSADPCGAFSMQGETEYGFIVEACRMADADPAVASVVFDINSPGGYVDGVDQAAQAMAAIAKPTEARVKGMAASCAYWLASQADKIVATSPADEIGSIGVACEWYDDDEAQAKKGVAHRVFTSTDAPDKRPDYSTDEGKSTIVKQLDALHRVFVTRVAEGRNVTPDKVNKDFGRGGVLIASAAKAAGMIDHIEGVSIARPRQTMDKPGVAGSAQTRGSASEANLKSKEVHMDLNQLKAEHPDAYSAARAEGFADGIKAEQSRREKIVAFKGINADGDKAVEDAIASGKAYEDVGPSIQAAVLHGKGANANGENAADLKTKAQATASGSAGIPEGMTAEDVEACRKAGMTDAEIKANGPKAGKE
jgi:ClpP class serine protease